MELEGASSRSRELKPKPSLSIRRCSNASVHLKTTAAAMVKAAAAAASNPDRKAKRKRLERQDSISAETKERQDGNLRHLKYLWTKAIENGRWGERECQRFLARTLLFREDDLPIQDRNIAVSDFLGCGNSGQKITIRCAKSALAYYNKQNPSAEFELVETIYCNTVGVVFPPQHWYHVNFVAKPKSASTNVSSLKVFFAELNDQCLKEEEEEEPCEGKVPICTCCVVDPKLSEVTTNCEMCKRFEIFHPVGAFPNAWKTSGTLFTFRYG